jgi:hypothetical protein
MQFDQQRAFPYPVLRPDINDYLEGDFQVTPDIQPADSADLGINARFECGLSVNELQEEITQGKASFAIVISCRETYYRDVLFSQERCFEHYFDGGVLGGEVQINPYIVARTGIENYSCPLINEEFGTGPFRFRPGSVLALDEPKMIYIDRDVFRPITSIFEIITDSNVGESEWRLRFNQPRVSIALSSGTKARIDLARNSTKNRAILINSIYFSAVMQCVRHLREGADYDDWRWAQVMRQQCLNLGIDLAGGEEYVTAERLMRHPLGLLTTYVFGDGA